MDKSSLFVSVILPAYNEKGNIIPLIEQIHDSINWVKHEIILVDDNSPDGTYQLVIDQHYSYVRCFNRIQNPSLGASIREGLEQAQGNVLVVMDSDFNHQPQYITQLVKNLEFYDVVMGSRFVYGGAMDSRWRHLLSWVFNIFVRLMTGKHITDSLYGFYAIKRSLLERIDYAKVFWGYGDYGIRLFYYIQENKGSVLQIPVVNGKRLTGTSNGRFLKTFWQYTVATIELVLEERFQIKKRTHG